jgi:hypothetical protein
MRKRIWISCIAILAVCLVLLFKAKQHHETVMPGPTETTTNLPMQVADGRYGRMTFSMIAGGQHFCMIDSVLNPSGSRNLEPSN